MPIELTFTHNFPYSFVDGNFRPIIPVSFLYRQHEYSYPMLVDSGAVATSLPPEHAKALGIEDLDALSEGFGTGVGGNTKYRLLEGVNIILAEREIEVTAPIRFVESMIGWEFGLLGREEVFKHLRIAFRENEGPYIFMALENSE